MFFTFVGVIRKGNGMETTFLNIETVTEYDDMLGVENCLRFYERQFITRQDANRDILTRFEALLDNYFTGGNASQKGLPSVKFCAGELCLSTNYFGDLIKKETGKTALEWIQHKIIGLAKEQLLIPSKSVSQIAYELGFQYPQHFTRVFKRAVGITPNEWRGQLPCVNGTSTISEGSELPTGLSNESLKA